MKPRPLLVLSLGLALLGPGCAAHLPPGMSADAYRQWRVQEYYRGHLRPADAQQREQLMRLASHTGPVCYGAAPAGSFCNRSDVGGFYASEPANNGRTRVVQDPTGSRNEGVVRAY